MQQRIGFYAILVGFYMILIVSYMILIAFHFNLTVRIYMTPNVRIYLTTNLWPIFSDVPFLSNIMIFWNFWVSPNF